MTFPVDVVCRGLLCVVLGTSGCAKLFTKGSIRSLSHEFAELIPWAGLRTPLAIGVVASELSVLVLLLGDMTYAAGLLLSAALMAVLSAGVLVIVVHHRSVRCACFGSLGRQLGPEHLARNLILMGIGILGFASSSGASLVSTIGYGLVGAALGVPVVLMDELIDVLSPTNVRHNR